MSLAPRAFLERLRTAGISPDDSEELRQQKSLLVFISGLISLASVLWLLIYSWMGPKFSSTLPFCLQVLVALNLWIYIRYQNFDLFRISQIGLLLFFPFVAQWAIGDFVSASGLLLWGLLAPVCALLCMGTRESLPWFAAYFILTALTGLSDYYLADFHNPLINSISRRISTVFFALNFLTLSTLIYLLLRFALLDRDRARSGLQKAHGALALEQARSERLLLNVLPPNIAARLKHSDATIADGFPQVSVMFVDIVNFTGRAAGMTPAQVFAMLNRIFSKFDELAERYQLEKIKTIGDAYMVAGGLQTGKDAPHNACLAIAQLAIAMQNWLTEDQANSREPLEIRIGISTGPVVAGIVGTKKFIYDLWGDTVNLASRITDESPPSGIQCDYTTQQRLAQHFRFEEPKVLELKGKGRVKVWRLPV